VPRFSDPKDEDHTPYTGQVLSFYGAADSLSLTLANLRESTPGPEAVYRRQLQRSPDDVAVLTALGKELLRQKKPDDAVPVLEKALRLKPMYTDARTHLAVAQALLGKHQTALAELQRAVADNPDDALAWTNLGITLEVIGDRNKARDAYSEAIRLQPDSAEARRRRSFLKPQ
jgi:Flp pilus assembly protein TadD